MQTTRKGTSIEFAFADWNNEKTSEPTPRFELRKCCNRAGHEGNYRIDFDGKQILLTPYDIARITQEFKGFTGRPFEEADYEEAADVADDTPIEHVRRYISSGHREHIRCDISRYIGLYFDFASQCRGCNYQIKDPSAITDAILEKYLARHPCLLRWMDRAPPFAVHVDQSRLAWKSISNRDVADWIWDNGNHGGTFGCFDDDVVREEWLDAVELWPKRFWTKSYIQAVANIWGDEVIQSLPEHLRTQEVYLTLIEYVQFWPDDAPINAEIIDTLVGRNEYSAVIMFYELAARMTPDEMEGHLLRHQGALQVFGAKEFEGLSCQHLEKILAVYPDAPVNWNIALAEHLLATDLADLVPEAYHWPAPKNPYK